MAGLSLQSVAKRFGTTDVVRDVSLEVAQGEFIVLVGPSGCGKSTTLRMIAGLEDVSAGRILFDDVIVNDLSPRERNIAMVFQSYALYPHMTVEQNLAFALQQRKVPKPRIAEIVNQTAHMLDIDELLARKPKELSGGQRQRVAMGRAVVREPDVFLFDEPLSNLDAALRAQMRFEIKKLHRLLGTTTVYVTHDQIEAMTLADRVVVMDRGEIVQVGRPMEVYGRPSTKFVAGFIGAPKINFLPGRVEQIGSDHFAVKAAPDVLLRVPQKNNATYAQYLHREIELAVRPEDIHKGEEFQPDAAFDADVNIVEPTGPDTMVVFSLGDVSVAARCRPYGRSEVGQRGRFSIDMSKAHLVDLASEQLIHPD
jgi:multiple sugar transport system ATP-binding protein